MGPSMEDIRGDGPADRPYRLRRTFLLRLFPRYPIALPLSLRNRNNLAWNALFRTTSRMPDLRDIDAMKRLIIVQ